jgi:hypothetical protein
MKEEVNLRIEYDLLNQNLILLLAFICRVARMAEWLRLGMKHLVAGNLSGHTEKRPGWK